MVPLSTQVYKWVPANLMLWVILQWTSIPSRGDGGGGGGVEICVLLDRKQEKFWPDGPLGSYTDFAFTNLPFSIQL